MTWTEGKKEGDSENENSTQKEGEGSASKAKKTTGLLLERSRRVWIISRGVQRGQTGGAEEIRQGVGDAEKYGKGMGGNGSGDSESPARETEDEVKSREGGSPL